jgi:hypothetical protein
MQLFFFTGSGFYFYGNLITGMLNTRIGVGAAPRYGGSGFTKKMMRLRFY